MDQCQIMVKLYLYFVNIKPQWALFVSINRKKLNSADCENGFTNDFCVNY